MKSVMVTCVLLLGLVGGFESARGAEEIADSPRYREATRLLDSWLQAVVDFERLPGLAVSVVHDQEVIYARGFGHQDADGRVAVTPRSVFSVCSITKILTAVAVMQLHEAGRLDVDDPVVAHLPWFTPEMPAGSRPPTLRDLLRHTGGLPCEPDHAFWPGPEDLFPDRDELVARAARVPFTYPVNENYNYSNLGYALLGEVVAVVAGMPYADYVQRRILEPLGMESTTLLAPRGELGGRLATGYGGLPRQGDRPEIGHIEHRALAPAGGYASTVLDLAKLASWQFRVLAGTDDGVLGRVTLQEMHKVQWTDPAWGLGFAIWRMHDEEFVGHWGGCPGYKSQIILCPERKIAATVMVNTTDADQFTLVFRTFEIISTILAAGDQTDDAGPDLAALTGSYAGNLAWSAAEVLTWEGELAVMWVPTWNPLGSLSKLRRIDGGTFREVKGEGELGKHYLFEIDGATGRTRMKFNSNILARIAP